MSKKETTKNVPAKGTSNLPAEMASANWGAVEAIDTTDLLVPKIFHQQAMSQFVQDGDASIGDCMDSLTGELLVKKGDTLELIIFHSNKSMLVTKYDDRSDRWNLDEIIPITPKNSAEMGAKPFSEEIGGEKFKYTMQYNMYGLIPSRIDELPYVLSLSVKKAKVAQKINTMIMKLSLIDRPGASIVFNLKSIKDSNDKGQWETFEVTQGRDSTDEEQKTAYAWYLKSKTQNFVPDEEAVAEKPVANGPISGEIRMVPEDELPF